jgi:excisionase family DNA binding protein
MRKLLTLEETALQTGYTVKAIRNLIFRGRFPYLKIGGRVRISEEELEKFLKISQRVTAEEAGRREAA